jgi:hypothetical protein
MSIISPPPLLAVTGRTIDYLAVMQRARGGPEEPYRPYIFGNGRKNFWSNHQSNGIYDKPVSIVNGVVTHLEDPSLISQNP